MTSAGHYAELEALALFLQRQGRDAAGSAQVVATMNGQHATELRGKARRFEKSAEWLIWLARNTNRIEQLRSMRVRSRRLR